MPGPRPLLDELSPGIEGNPGEPVGARHGEFLFRVYLDGSHCPVRRPFKQDGATGNDRLTSLRIRPDSVMMFWLRNVKYVDKAAVPCYKTIAFSIVL